ncbi:MAG: FGGY family carbohydrate kinase, partial [Gammaproteobacteria bacterium]|nr:FGGY family carbohydrate kinase [Gammaproteobacteria bacterium]
MTKQFLLAIDQGTSSSRTVIYDDRANVVASAQQEFRQIYPESGWVEHDPEEIWASVRQVTREALAKAGITIRDIAGIGITNQRETTVVWDRRSGECIYNAIVWQDRRTAAYCRDLRERCADEVVAGKTGLR